MPAPAELAAWGLPGLFLLALASGSVLPLPTEAVAAAMVWGGARPGLVWAAASAGNVLGALTLYLPGRWAAAGGGGRAGAWVRRRLEAGGARGARARARVRRWGAPVLLLSWLPVVGDLLVLAAGLLGVRAAPAVLCIAAGKGLRYAAVVAAAHAALGASAG